MTIEFGDGDSDELQRKKRQFEVKRMKKIEEFEAQKQKKLQEIQARYPTQIDDIPVSQLEKKRSSNLPKQAVSSTPKGESQLSQVPVNEKKQQMVGGINEGVRRSSGSVQGDTSNRSEFSERVSVFESPAVTKPRVVF